MDDDQELDNNPNQPTGNDAGDNGTGGHEPDAPEDDITPSGDQDDDQGDPTNKPPTPTGEDEGEDDWDDEDDDLEDFAPPIVRGGAPTGTSATQLDIRTLPRDANGAIVPDQANAKIEEYVQQRIAQDRQSFSQENEQTTRTRETLTSQWQTGFKKFPAVAKNKDLATYARDIHLRSIEDYKAGTGPYISPTAAIKRADRMFKRAAKSGYQSAKTRRRIEKAGQSETTQGRSSQGKQSSPYEAARKKALSSDPNVAREGREEIMKLRRAARRK